MKAVGWRLLVKSDVAKSKTRGGILLPATSKDAQEALMNKGLVVDVGPAAYKSDRFTVPAEDGGYVLSEPWCKVGDYIVFDKHAGRQIKILEDGEEVTYKFVNDTDVLAVVDQEEMHAIKTYIFSDAQEF